MARSSIVDLQLIERQFDSARPSSDQPVSGGEVVLAHDHRAAGAEAGCVPPPGRRVVRWRTRRGTVPGRSVGDRYTTGAPVESGCRHDRGGRRRHDLESNRSSRQSSATLGATCLQHGTPTASAHAGAEAVCLGTTAGIWLKGTLHGISGSSGDTRRRRPAMRQPA